jgi:L-alanine-DL-glutamate epimerase-like enolase superfamily enzyme
MPHREFVLVRVGADSGLEGFAFTLTREGPVAAAIGQAIRSQYVGQAVATRADASELFTRCQRSNLATLSSGVGLRALSVVDIAVHDLLAKSSGVSIARYLGGVPRSLPATAIIGYPPAAMDAGAVREQVRALRAAGWQRFKLPIALPLEYARERAFAAREAAGEDAWLGLDCAWLFSRVDEATRFLQSLREVRLGCFEDVFPPGDAEIIAKLRALAGGVPIAMGDEQGGSYYPAALLAEGAVDIVRIDLTCMGGITCMPRLVARCEQAGVGVAPHMFAHVHSQALAGLGYEAPIEWGVPGTGVDQFADSLAQPMIVDGRMDPLPEAPGFGSLLNQDWLSAQDVDDPEGLLASIVT